MGKRAPGISGMKPAQRKKVVNPELFAAQRKPSGPSSFPKHRRARALPLKTMLHSMRYVSVGMHRMPYLFHHQVLDREEAIWFVSEVSTCWS